MRTAVVFLALTLSLVGCGQKKADQAAASAPEPNRVAAPAFTLPDLAGKAVSLSQFRGKVVFLDFWATWCPPCRMTIPALQKMYTQYKDRGFEVVGISLDEAPGSVKEFAKTQGLTYTLLFAGGSNISGTYQVQGIPTLYMLDKKGKVARHWVGFDPSFVDEWRSTFEKLERE